ncbi:hypothetical protein [Variovorax sp. PBL-E5]|uniref:hypothetical protein n=1 Tax=Variovorax sp. PBL-E5 TaxID=434014 RepID=UPI0013A591B1|nr:hypothetical protein [Variovorax sp. PBL-E5]
MRIRIATCDRFRQLDGRLFAFDLQLRREVPRDPDRVDHHGMDAQEHLAFLFVKIIRDLFQDSGPVALVRKVRGFAILLATDRYSTWTRKARARRYLR